MTIEQLSQIEQFLSETLEVIGRKVDISAYSLTLKAETTRGHATMRWNVTVDTFRNVTSQRQS